MKPLQDDRLCLIFCHYGDTNYLNYTLPTARRTNPDARLIMLGDACNQAVSERSGWEHYPHAAYVGPLYERFARVYRPVKGPTLIYEKGGRDWLKFVFQRIFHLESFMAQHGLERVWFFDSDTMILTDLADADARLKSYDFTVQCNGACCGGIVTRAVLTEFCETICTLFEDDAYMAAQQHEFDTVHPKWAFTEMRAFEHYMAQTSRPWLHLLQYSSDEIFDDSICQPHGCELTQLANGQYVKNVLVIDGKFYVLQQGEIKRLLTLNLSWVPDELFAWVQDGLDQSRATLNTLQIAND